MALFTNDDKRLSKNLINSGEFFLAINLILFIAAAVLIPFIGNGIIRILLTLLIIFLLPGMAISLLIYRIFTFERILSSVIFSLSYWIFIGKIMLQFAVPITSHNLYLAFLLPNIIFFGLSFLKYGPNRVFNAIIRDRDSDFYLKFSLKESKLGPHLNTLLLIIFTILLAFFAIIRADILPVGDPWFHAKITEKIIMNGTIPSNTYRGDLGYHFIGAMFGILTGIPTITIAKYAGLIQIPLTVALFYAFLLKLISNRNIVILNTIVLESTILSTTCGIINSQLQYWPTALVLIFALQIYSLFFERYALFQKKQSGLVKNDLLLYFGNMIALFLAVGFIHSFSFVILIIPLLIISILMLREEQSFWQDVVVFFTILILALGTFEYPIINFFSNFFKLMKFSHISGDYNNTWYNIFALIGIILLGAAVAYFIYNFLKKWTYHKDLGPEGIFDEESNSAITIERKYFKKIILPVLIISMPFILKYLIFSNFNYYSAHPFFIIASGTISAVLFAIYVIMVNIYRQKGYDGKIQFIYFLTIAFSVITLTILDKLYPFILRLALLWIPVITISFGYYIKWNLKQTNSFNVLKIILTTFVLLNLGIAIGFNTTLNEDVTDDRLQFCRTTVFLMEDFNENENVSGRNVIIGSFFMAYPYYFYGDSNKVIYDQSNLAALIPRYNSSSGQYYFDSEQINQTRYKLEQYYGAKNIYIYIDADYFYKNIKVGDNYDLGVLSPETYGLYYIDPNINKIAAGSYQQSLFILI